MQATWIMMPYGYTPFAWPSWHRPRTNKQKPKLRWYCTYLLVTPEKSTRHWSAPALRNKDLQSVHGLNRMTWEESSFHTTWQSEVSRSYAIRSRNWQGNYQLQKGGAVQYECVFVRHPIIAFKRCSAGKCERNPVPEVLLETENKRGWETRRSSRFLRIFFLI